MIIVDRPPNFDEVLAAFPNADKPGVIFAYDGHVYNPSGGVIPPALLAHENVHLNRQMQCGPREWWKNYLVDDEFRYQEELLAHVAEFKAQSATADRNFGARLLTHTAMRLIAPLYNYNPPYTLRQAIRDIKSKL
jgi:hypothetical protein